MCQEWLEWLFIPVTADHTSSPTCCHSVHAPFWLHQTLLLTLQKEVDYRTVLFAMPLSVFLLVLPLSLSLAHISLHPLLLTSQFVFTLFHLHWLKFKKCPDMGFTYTNNRLLPLGWMLKEVAKRSKLGSVELLYCGLDRHALSLSVYPCDCVCWGIDSHYMKTDCRAWPSHKGCWSTMRVYESSLIALQPFRKPFSHHTRTDIFVWDSIFLTIRDLHHSLFPFSLEFPFFSFLHFSFC